MKKILLPLILLFSLPSLAAKNADQLEVEKLIKTIFKKEDLEKSSFEASGCNYQEEKWLALLIGGPSFKEEIKFAKKCDLQGSFSPVMAKNFPVKLHIRKFPDYTQIAGLALIRLSLELEPKLLIKLTQAKLTGPKKSVEFDLSYEATINPLNSDIIEKDLGGKLFIRKINGKKIEKEYPLKGHLK